MYSTLSVDTAVLAAGGAAPESLGTCITGPVEGADVLLLETAGPAGRADASTLPLGSRVFGDGGCAKGGPLGRGSWFKMKTARLWDPTSKKGLPAQTLGGRHGLKCTFWPTCQGDW